MPAHVFLMSGEASTFRLSEQCEVTKGPHHADPDSFLVAEAAVRDGSAVVRLALWRCQCCKTLLVGVGNPSGVLDGDPAGRVAVDAQEFTWLEENVMLAGSSE